MTSSIDPIRGPRAPRRARRATDDIPHDDVQASESGGTNLPIPLGPARTVPPKDPAVGGAGIEAQLLGQTGARRGLRAGPTVIDTARHSYNRTEWSGAKDRRTPKGRAAKTDI